MLEAFATSRNLDNYENTVWLRIAPLEGTASWRSETMFLDVLYRVIQTKLLQEPLFAHCAPPPFMANAILNFHFDFLHTSLSTSHQILTFQSMQYVLRCSSTNYKLQKICYTLGKAIKWRVPEVSEYCFLDQIRIRILFGIRILTEYEYE